MYSRQIKDKERFFGVSGLLYRSNVLMYDRGSESLWSQIKGEAVTGPLTGTELEVLPSTLTTWKKWRKQHPETQVLSLETGYSRNYELDPYLDYYRQQSGFRSFFKLGPGEKEKELVVGVVIAGQARAYPLAQLKTAAVVKDRLAGKELTLSFDSATDRLSVVDGQGNRIEPMTAYWFVWKAIWPQTERYPFQLVASILLEADTCYDSRPLATVFVLAACKSLDAPELHYATNRQERPCLSFR